MTPQERELAKGRFLEALNTFTSAAQRLRDVWMEELHTEDQDWPAEAYPFARSFDEEVSQVVAWNEIVGLNRK